MTPAANDLFLTTIHDGKTYQQRKHAAKKAQQGYHDRQAYRRECREIINDTAKASRDQFGSKYKPQDITQAAHELADYMSQHARELTRDQYDPSRPILATIKRWFDKTAGNSYFSVMVQIPQESGIYTLFYIPRQYGYGNQPEWDTIDALIELGLFDRKDRSTDHPNAYPVQFTDAGYTLKRHL
jgi:hypothetical protein